MSASRYPVINCYQVLQVSPGADLNEINGAYKRLALKYHPDKTGGSMEEFRKIQTAVEVLRDPVRRCLHDQSIKCLERRADFPSVYKHSSSRTPKPPGRPKTSTTAQASSAAGADHIPPFNYDSAFVWSPDSGRVHLGSDRDRYMWSYSNSVHMNPQSTDSKEELKRCEEEKAKTDDIRRRLFEEKERQEKRKAAMKAHLEREDEEYGERSYDMSLNNSVQSPPACAPEDEYYKYTENGREKFPEPQEYHGQEDEEQEYEEDYEEAEYEEEDYDEEEYNEEEECDEKEEEEEANSFPCEEDLTTLLSSSNADNVSSTGPFESAKEDLSSSELELHFYFSCDDSVDVKSSNTPNENPPAYESPSTISLSSVSAGAPFEAEDLTEEQYNEWDPIEIFRSCRVNMDSAIAPFIPYLNAKLNHPSGQYSPEDLHCELQGLFLETFCGWLETQRLLIPGAAQLKTGLRPEECTHLGYWDKHFDTDECEACHRWMPMYTLTCPGCGIKACVSCKFRYNQPRPLAQPESHAQDQPESQPQAQSEQ